MKINHHKALPADVIESAMALFGKAELAFNTRGTPEYERNLTEIPEAWRNKYHVILLWAAQWNVMLFESNRGREVF